MSRQELLRSRFSQTNQDEVFRFFNPTFPVSRFRRRISKRLTTKNMKSRLAAQLSMTKHSWHSRRVSRYRILLVLAITIAASACEKLSFPGIHTKSTNEQSGGPLQIINSNERAEREAFETEIRDLVQKGEYEQLESRADAYRASKARFTNSNLKLRVFYSTFLDFPVDRDDTQWMQFIQSIENWIRKKPESVTARVALAQAYRRYAWKARGGGWSTTVTPEGYRLMQQRLAVAGQLLNEAKLLPQKCPGWYGAALSLALGTEMTRKEYDRLFADAVSSVPDYDAIYDYTAYYLLPRWYGQPGEWESFAGTMMQRSDIPDAKEIFAKSALYLNGMGFFDSEFSSSRKSSVLLKESFLALQKHYPRSLEINSVFCLASVKMYDYRQIREQLKLIGGRFDPFCWQSPEKFQEVVKFAASNNAALERGYKDFLTHHR